MKKIRFLAAIIVSTSLFSTPALSADSADVLIRDLLVDACGSKMKAATIKKKASADWWNNTSFRLKGLIRISLAGKTVDSDVNFAFGQADAFEPGKFRLLKHIPTSIGFLNDGGIREAFNCTGGRLREPFDADFYDRTLKFNFR